MLYRNVLEDIRDLDGENRDWEKAPSNRLRQILAFGSKCFSIMRSKEVMEWYIEDLNLNRKNLDLEFLSLFDGVLEANVILIEITGIRS